MCRFYDTSVSNSCTEPVAEKVGDKTRKNFCGYFQPNPAAWQPDDQRPADDARKHLDALFGLGDNAAAGEDESRRKLDDLFGLKKDK
jgi:hypothetical protein